MRHIVRLVNLVDLASFDRLPVLTRLRTPPVDLVDTRSTEDFHPRRPIRRIATQFLVDVEIPGRVGVEAGEDGLLVAACLSGLLEFDLRCSSYRTPLRMGCD